MENSLIENKFENWLLVLVILISFLFIFLPEIDIPIFKVNLSNLIIPIFPLIYFAAKRELFFEKIKRFKKEIIFATLFFIYLILLSLISPYPKISILYTIKLAEFFPVLLLGLILYEKRFLVYILILWISIFLGIINIILFFYPNLYKTIFYERPYTYPRMQSLVGHPNPYAFSILIFFIVLFLLYKNQIISSITFSLTYSFNLLNLILTGSKNNFLVFILLSLYFIFMFLKDRKKILAIYLILILLISTFLFYILWIKSYYQFWFNFFKILEKEEERAKIKTSEVIYKYSIERYEGGSIGVRKEIYKIAIDTLKKYPLGIGPYVFREFIKNNKTITTLFGENLTGFASHNIILQMWLDFGIVGILLIFGIIYLFLNLKSYLRLFWLIMLIGNLLDYFLTNIFILYLTVLFLGFSICELKYEKNTI